MGDLKRADKGAFTRKRHNLTIPPKKKRPLISTANSGETNDQLKGGCGKGVYDRGSRDGRGRGIKKKSAQMARVVNSRLNTNVARAWGGKKSIGVVGRGKNVQM